MLSLLLYAVGMAAQQPDWGYNPNAYPDEHVIYVGLTEGSLDNCGQKELPENTYLGAFIDGECRGLAKVQKKSLSVALTINYFPLRVKGDTNDEGKAISFRLLYPGGQLSYVYDLQPAADAVTYTNKKTTGTLSDLFPLKFIQPLYYGFTQETVSVKVGEQINLLDYITFEPANANIPELNWNMYEESENVIIEGNKLTAIKSTGKYGSVGVFPKLWDMKNTGQYSDINIRVIQPATSIELRDEYKNGITVNLGDTAALNTVLRSGYTTAPADCNEELTWKSSDETAIRPMTSESDLGKFNPVKAGTYTMTLSGENASVDLKVTVVKPVEYINPVGRVKEIKMYIGDNLLDILPSGYKVMPEDATDRSVRYEVLPSYNQDQEFKYNEILEDKGSEGIFARKPGRARIAIISNQNPQASCTYEVIVKDGPTNITFKQEEMTFLMPIKDTDKWDISEDIRNNIIMTPSWPKYEEYESYDIAQSNLDISSLTDAVKLSYDFKKDIISASVVKVGEGWIDISYSSERTIATEEGLQNDEYYISNHFHVTILESLKGFKVDGYVDMVSTETRDFVLTPDPVDAEVDPSRVEVTIEDASVPEMWKSIVEIVPTDETMLNYTIRPHSVGRATISVKLDGVEVATSHVGIGQRYMQKAGWKWTSLYSGGVPWNSPEIELGNVVEEIRSEDALLHNDPEYGYFGDLNRLEPGTCYKIKVKEEEPGLLNLRIYPGGYEDMRPYRQIVPMWNWLGNPYQYDHDINSVFSTEDTYANKFNVGDRIVSKDNGFAEYNGEKWTGTLTTLHAGLGYMYFNAASDTINMELKYEWNMPQGTPVMNAPQHKQSVWTYNSAPFADNMTIVADLGNEYSAERFTVGAFVGDECRGEGEMIDGKCFITVHADKGETISFKLHDAVSGEMRTINEQMPFAKMAGSLRAPQRLTVGGIVTGITAADIASSGIAIVDGQITVLGMDVADVIVCNASGAVVSTGETTVTGLPSGVYVVKVKTKDGKTVTKKLVK